MTVNNLLNGLLCKYLSLVDRFDMYSGERLMVVMADDSRFFIMLA